jgi:hypothetical protein
MTFNIDELTYGQIKEIAALIGGASQSACSNDKHPMIGKYCIVRTFSAGVHIGVVKDVMPALQGSDVLFESSRRLWKWVGAFTLSEVANNGVKSTSRIAEEVIGNMVTGANEFLLVSPKAKKTIEACHEK